MITIKDVAAEAGVSIVTVSRVINSPELVSDKRRERVQQAIQKLGYSPNDVARALVKKNTNMIGVLLPDITNIFTPHVIASISNTLEASGYQIFLCITGGKTERENSFLTMLAEKRVDGLMLLGPRQIAMGENQVLDRISQRIPVVALDYTADCNMYCVRSDEASGAYQAVKYLVELGHRKIGFINGTGGFATYFYKQAGFENALEEFGIPWREDYVVRVAPYYEGGVEGTERLLALADRPTAILTAGDQIALGVYFAVQSRGMKIPEELSIIGFSGSVHPNFIYPRLTTVDQHAEQMGQKAAELIVRILRHEAQIDRNVILEPQLIVRDSCKAVCDHSA